MKRLVCLILCLFVSRVGANQAQCEGPILGPSLSPTAFSRLAQQKGQTHIVELPYTTPRIEGLLVEAPDAQLPIAASHKIALFKTSRPTEVIMTLKMKIGHAPFIKTLPPDVYVIVSFETQAAVTEFAQAISGSYELQATFRGRPAVIMNVAETFIAQNRLSPAATASSANISSATTISRPVGIEELKALSTHNVQTFNGTVYYFNGTKPVGYSKAGRAERYLNLENSREGFGSHEEILKRQLGVEFRPTSTIQEQIKDGRIFSKEKLHEIGLGEDSADIQRV